MTSVLVDLKLISCYVFIFENMGKKIYNLVAIKTVNQFAHIILRNISRFIFKINLLPTCIVPSLRALVVGSSIYLFSHDNRVHCAESGEESSESESVYSLKCHISHEVNHLHEGLKHVSCIAKVMLYSV